jgi:hypothetical protein
VAKYNLDQAWLRRVEAFERVSTHVAKIVRGADDNVVTLPNVFNFSEIARRSDLTYSHGSHRIELRLSETSESALSWLERKQPSN